VIKFPSIGAGRTVFFNEGCGIGTLARIIRLLMDRKPNRILVLICLFVFLALLFSALHPSLSLAKNVTLGWDANPEPDLAGYVVYRNDGSPGPPYKYDDTLPEDDLADPLNPMVTITGLSEKKEYYIAVTAYDTEGKESDFSDDVCVKIVNSVIENCSASISAISGSGNSGGGGGGCFISSAAGNSNDLPVILCALVVVGLVLTYKANWLKKLIARS